MLQTWEGYRHGVNLGGWLSQCNHTKERYDRFITEDDIRVIASWGLDHIRVPVDYNLVEDELHRKMNWVALGNKFNLGKLAVDIDYIDRFSGKQKHFFSDWSAILKAILSVGKWNICTKVGYERNDASNIDPNWKEEWNTLVSADHIGSYDLVLPAGNDYLYAGFGFEYFPLGNDNLRLHFAYFGDNHDRVHNFDIGVTWRFKIYKRQQQ